MNYEKIIISVACLLGITLLGYTHVVNSEAVVGVYSSVIGFTLGTFDKNKKVN